MTRKPLCRFALPILCLLVVWAGHPHPAMGQAQAPASTNLSQSQAGHAVQPPADAPDPEATLTLFPHSETARYWISGQTNIILQWHPAFAAKYSGPNSLRSGAENATSKVYTLYLGYQFTQTTEVFLDAESAGGRGISDALGLAGFTNLDVVRNTDLGPSPYLARLMIRQIIPLGKSRISAERGPLALANSLPGRRIEIRAGKFSAADFFDLNSWGSDSHLQFLNWTVDNNGAYDYPANTRGYTDGVMIEYDDGPWSARFGEMLMPKVANGLNLDANVARSRSENLEIEKRGSLLPSRPGAVRLLSYLNHANMGNYQDAVADYLSGKAAAPDIIATRRQGRHKYGFGLNFEQGLTRDIGFFGRLGWSDGRNESFAYTEVDRTLQMGTLSHGRVWKRPNDRVGVAVVINGIVAAHREYLALGGRGFLLGDDGLRYGSEKIPEWFYTAHLWRGVFASFDLQHINNPGYNKDRGPVLVPGLRLHVEM